MIKRLKNLRLYLDTLRHLKTQQVFYQVFYRIKKIVIRGPFLSDLKVLYQTRSLKLQPSISSPQSFFGNRFSFLNQEKLFEEKINWNFSGHGKLWAYNLNYFDFLNQAKLDQKEALALIDSYCNASADLKVGVEPYPISLRGVNWIKFFTKHKINNPRYNAILFSHYKFLASNLEYHLMGNHLLENGFSLLFAAYYFNNETFYRKATKILKEQLKEQTLKDGGHFELSPMYHQILLFHLLDCINLLKNNPRKSEVLSPLLTATAVKMLGWARTVIFSNGEIPMVNDSSPGIAPLPEEIFNYGIQLGLSIKFVQLSDSGYRMLKIDRMELFADVGNIGPDYIPGHAHSDTFNFILFVDGQPVIVEVGTSTYAPGRLRIAERSTQSHNTVTFDNHDQSEVWASFRVGRRAKVIGLNEQSNKISASHDGYKFLGIMHTRTWQWTNQNLLIYDEISGDRKNRGAIARIHFHPALELKIENEEVHAGPAIISCTGYTDLIIEEYDFSLGYNLRQRGKLLKIHFTDKLTVQIKISTASNRATGMSNLEKHFFPSV